MMKKAREPGLIEVTTLKGEKGTGYFSAYQFYGL
jgi:hypothetical protein